MKKILFCCFLMMIGIACHGENISNKISDPGEKTYVNPIFDNSEDASGHFDMSEIIVYGFSHDGPDEDDPQVYEKLIPDMGMRLWHAGWGDSTPASRYNLEFLNKCRKKNIVFMGGLNGSSLYRSDADDEREFQDWSTLDAEGNPVVHTELDNSYNKNMRRASIANPKYREHLMKKIRMQIDLGADGIVIDEADADGYYGSSKYHFNGNEGFDDYFIADFNLYLMNKYPDYHKEDWINKFKMTGDNIIKSDVPYNDLKNNFNYRKYLQDHDWATDPRNRGWGGKNCSANPLAKEWGNFPASSRLVLDDPDFLNKAIRLYWKEIVLEIRKYAREKYNKEIIVTANGIFPYVDMNQFGLWNYNQDDNGKEADYMPVTGDGHLNGSKSLMKIFKSLYRRNRDVAGNVPMVLFLDWPTKFIGDYYKLSIPEKEDFWQIYVPEAYACGLFYAFHLRTCYNVEPSATQSGVIDFMSQYAQFYKNNKEIYKNAVDADISAAVSAENVEYNIMKQISKKRFLVHLINHNYNKRIVPKSGFTVTVNTEIVPVSIQLVSPDLKEMQNVEFSCSNSQVVMNIKSIKYYNILLINW